MLQVTVLMLACFEAALCIPLTDFFPFGAASGDSVLARMDDISSPPINLSIIFPYFGMDYDTVYVNDNGIISFTNPFNDFDPLALPLNGTPGLIAVYWADTDTRPDDGGFVWFREANDSVLLTRFQQELQSAFPNEIIFVPTSLLIVTWDHVGYNNRSTNLTNTFQCVMGTDENRAYLIFLYADDEIQWTTADTSGGINGFGGNPAVAGLNVGDGVRFIKIPGSRTPAVINITSTSNVNKPGVWIFRVDSDNGTVTPSAGADPHFVCPLRNGENLCFSIQGIPEFIFNLFSDLNFQLNSKFGLPTVEESHLLMNSSTFIQQFGLIIKNPTTNRLVKIKISALDHSIHVADNSITAEAYPMTIRITNSTVTTTTERVSANPDNDETAPIRIMTDVGFAMKFKFVKRHIDYVITESSGLTSATHGIQGQFMVDGVHIVDGMMKIGSRSTPFAVKKGVIWPYLHQSGNCWYPTHTNDQGGGVLEGDYTDYIVDGLFGSNFKFNQFK